MIQHGMWDVFNMQDPHSPGRSWDLFQFHSRFPLHYVQDYIAHLRQSEEIDRFITENLTWSAEYLFNTLSHGLHSKVLREVELTSSGPEVFVATMNVITSDSYDAMQETEKKLKEIKLKDFPGENVEDACAQIVTLSETLEGAGYWRHELLADISKVFEESSDTHFKLWAMDTYRGVKRYVEDLRVTPVEMITGQHYTYKSLTIDACAEYRSLRDSKRYEPLKNKAKGSEPELPKGYAALVRQEVSKQMGGKGTGGGRRSQGGGGKSGDENPHKDLYCHGCGEKGHIKPNCPKKDTATNRDGNNRGNGQTQGNNLPFQGCKPEDAWKFKRANNRQWTMVNDGNTLHWCTKCYGGKGMWREHHTNGHEEWKSQRAQHFGRNNGGRRVTFASNVNGGNGGGGGSSSNTSGNTNQAQSDESGIQVGGLARHDW